VKVRVGGYGGVERGGERVGRGGLGMGILTHLNSRIERGQPL